MIKKSLWLTSGDFPTVAGRVNSWEEKLPGNVKNKYIKRSTSETKKAACENFHHR